MSRPDAPAPAPTRLDALAWHALGSTHAPLARPGPGGGDLARAYDPEVTAFAGLRDGSEAAWQALAALLAPAEVVIVSGRGPFDPPDGWIVEGGAYGHQMVLERFDDLPEVAPVEIVGLGDQDVPQMLDLVRRTQPGPFRRRTIEMGRYYGAFAEGRLIAMAGERLQTPDYGEISAVCTDPAARGRGLAAALTRHVAAGMVDRGQTPLLHVEEHNDGARRVYERLGFRTRIRVPFVVVRAPSAEQPESQPAARL